MSEPSCPLCGRWEDVSSVESPQGQFYCACGTLFTGSDAAASADATVVAQAGAVPCAHRQWAGARVTKRRNTYSAPVVPIEYPADGDPIYPCTQCLPWYVEVVPDHPEGGVWVREWHAIGCVWLEWWLSDEDEDAAE